MPKSSHAKNFFDSSVLKPFLTAGMLFLNIIFLCGGCGQTASKGEVDQLKGRLDQLEKQLTQLESQSSEIKESVTRLDSSGKTLEQQIVTLTENIDKLAQVSPPPAKTLPAGAQVKKQYHQVMPGETLYSISKKYGLSVGDVRRLNNLTQDQSIQPGQKLLIMPGRNQ